MWGCKFFCVFRMTRRWGCKFLRTRRRSEWNVLRMWGLRRRRRRREEEEDVGNHVRKELVPYFVNYKESAPLPVNEIYMLVLL
jgi:hypothetical protein